jgi:hypothetical protein
VWGRLENSFLDLLLFIRLTALWYDLPFGRLVRCALGHVVSTFTELDLLLRGLTLHEYSLQLLFIKVHRVSLALALTTICLGLSDATF